MGQLEDLKANKPWLLYSLLGLAALVGVLFVYRLVNRGDDSLLSAANATTAVKVEYPDTGETAEFPVSRLMMILIEQPGAPAPLPPTFTLTNPKTGKPGGRVTDSSLWEKMVAQANTERAGYGKPVSK